MTTPLPQAIADLVESLCHQPTAKQSNVTRLRLYLNGFGFSEIAELEGVTPSPVRYSILPHQTFEIRKWHKARREERLKAEAEAKIAIYRPCVIVLALAGHTNATIAASLEITEALVGSVIATLEADILIKRKSVQKKGKSKYTRQQMIDALLEAAALNEGRIGITRFRQLRRNHRNWPSADLYQVKGWNWWIEQAGLPVNAQPAGYGQFTYDEADYRAATNRIGLIYEEAYSKSQYNRQRQPGEPSSGAIARYCGNGDWATALEYLSPHLFPTSTVMADAAS